MNTASINMAIKEKYTKIPLLAKSTIFSPILLVLRDIIVIIRNTH